MEHSVEAVEVPRPEVELQQRDQRKEQQKIIKMMVGRETRYKTRSTCPQVRPEATAETVRTMVSMVGKDQEHPKECHARGSPGRRPQ